MAQSKDYLHPKWQKKRLEVLERDNFTCVECGDKENTLHVHHSHYVKGKKVWKYNNCTFETLCDSCHQKKHEDIKSIDQYKIKRLSDLLQRVNDRATAKYSTKKDQERFVYYQRLFIDYVLYGKDGLLFVEFEENEKEEDEEINNFKILESLMFYLVNERNVKTYVEWCICMNGRIDSPKYVGKHILEVRRLK